jgi:hypothetical protein
MSVRHRTFRTAVVLLGAAAALMALGGCIFVGGRHCSTPVVVRGGHCH